MNRMPALQLLMKMSTNDYSLLQRFWIRCVLVPKLAFSSFSSKNETNPPSNAHLTVALSGGEIPLQRITFIYLRDSDEIIQTAEEAFVFFHLRMTPCSGEHTRFR